VRPFKFQWNVNHTGTGNSCSCFHYPARGITSPPRYRIHTHLNSPGRFRLNPKPVHVTFMLDRLPMGQVFLRNTLDLPSLNHSTNALYSSSSSPSSSTCFYYRRTHGRRLGTFQIATLFRKSESIGWKKIFRLKGVKH